jgi:hypothetical protein
MASLFPDDITDIDPYSDDDEWDEVEINPECCKKNLQNLLELEEEEALVSHENVDIDIPDDQSPPVESNYQFSIPPSRAKNAFKPINHESNSLFTIPPRKLSQFKLPSCDTGLQTATNQPSYDDKTDRTDVPFQPKIALPACDLSNEHDTYPRDTNEPVPNFEQSTPQEKDVSLDVLQPALPPCDLKSFYESEIKSQDNIEHDIPYQPKIALPACDLWNDENAEAEAESEEGIGAQNTTENTDTTDSTTNTLLQPALPPCNLDSFYEPNITSPLLSNTTDIPNQIKIALPACDLTIEHDDEKQKELVIAVENPTIDAEESRTLAPEENDISLNILQPALPSCELKSLYEPDITNPILSDSSDVPYQTIIELPACDLSIETDIETAHENAPKAENSIATTTEEQPLSSSRGIRPPALPSCELKSLYEPKMTNPILSDSSDVPIQNKVELPACDLSIETSIETAHENAPKTENNIATTLEEQPLYFSKKVLSPSLPSCELKSLYEPDITNPILSDSSDVPYQTRIELPACDLSIEQISRYDTIKDPEITLHNTFNVTSEEQPLSSKQVLQPTLPLCGLKSLHEPAITNPISLQDPEITLQSTTRVTSEEKPLSSTEVPLPTLPSCELKSLHEPAIINPISLQDPEITLQNTTRVTAEEKPLSSIEVPLPTLPSCELKSLYEPNSTNPTLLDVHDEHDVPSPREYQPKLRHALSLPTCTLTPLNQPKVTNKFSLPLHTSTTVEESEVSCCGSETSESSEETIPNEFKLLPSQSEPTVKNTSTRDDLLEESECCTEETNSTLTAPGLAPTPGLAPVPAELFKLYPMDVETCDWTCPSGIKLIPLRSREEDDYGYFIKARTAVPVTTKSQEEEEDCCKDDGTSDPKMAPPSPWTSSKANKFTTAIPLGPAHKRIPISTMDNCCDAFVPGKPPTKPSQTLIDAAKIASQKQQMLLANQYAQARNQAAGPISSSTSTSIPHAGTPVVVASSSGTSPATTTSAVNVATSMVRDAKAQTATQTTPGIVPPAYIKPLNVPSGIVSVAAGITISVLTAALALAGI